MLNKKWIKKLTHMDQNDLDNQLLKSCEEGNLEEVKYLLFSPELNKHADILANNGSHLKWAGDEGHIEVVKYLLTSPDLKEHADVNAQQDGLFFHCLLQKRWDILNFLIIDYNIEKTDWINMYLNKDKELISEDRIIKANNIFELKELNKNLTADLKKDIQKKELKIKL